MDLQKDHLLNHLLSLRPTEEHLKSLAYYIKTFENNDKTLVDGIRFAHEKSSIHHRITLYYLINEILCMATTPQLKSELKAFVNESFVVDLKESVKFEILNKKLLELERVWSKRKIIGEGIDVDEMVYKIKEACFDKSELVNLFKDFIKRLEKQE